MVKVIRDFKVKFNPEMILHLIDCPKNSPIYGEMMEEFRSIEIEAIGKVEPIALLAFGEIPKEIANLNAKEGTKALYCLATVGDKLSKWSSDCFRIGEYVSGLMLDAMADDILFQLDGFLKDEIVTLCKEKKMGVARRLEAPIDIGMEAQKLIWERTKALDIAGVNIKESYMFYPVKTICQIYLLDEACEEYHVEHQCDQCTNYDCRLREVLPKRVTVLINGEFKEIFVKERQTLLESLIEYEIYTPAICGGRGTCGKCTIFLKSGDIAISKEDEKFFSKEQLEEGRRLSCMAFPKSDCLIKLQDGEEDFLIVTEFKDNGVKPAGKKLLGSLVIIIDIGTTTIAMQLIQGKEGTILDTYTANNTQRSYGADVISRIMASNNGEKVELQKCIQKDLNKGIEYFASGLKNIYDNGVVDKIIIAGNTTMIHLLMGYSCETLGVYPFTPFNKEWIDTEYNAIFQLNENTASFSRVPLKILPSISGFVGADITAGIISCNMFKNDKITLLIDLGTNGEMAIGNKERILVTSTAAGPAFEGGNISCGVGSIGGAINSLIITEKHQVEIETIAKKAPIGICGTGVVEIVSEMLKAELIDETGLLDEDYFEEGYIIVEKEDGSKIVFTQKDIREVQLAKSAIRAGVEILIKRFGITFNEVEKVYLAGGFGYKMNIQKAISIGMFPTEFEDKIEAVGNSSLNGCKEIAVASHEIKDCIDCFLSNAREINLSMDKEFQDLYMQYMCFD